jgi:hypothetical protein
VSLPAYGDIPEPRPPERAGLSLLADILVAPARAYATIAATRAWLPAFIVVMTLTVVGALLLAPALEHLITIDPTLAGSSPADIKTMTGHAVADFLQSQVIGILVLWLWTAAVMTTLARTGPRTFGLYFALAANTALPAALGNFIFALVISLHDPHAYANLSQLNRAVPDNLAVFEPHDKDRAVGFLASFDLFTLWSTLLLAFGVRAIGNVRLLWALIAAFSLWLAYVLLQTFSTF